MAAMKRYKGIISDFEKFKEIMRKPPPNDVRVNTIKSSPEEIEKTLVKEGVKFDQRKWNDLFFTIRSNPSDTIFHWLGEYYIQEFTSGIPSLALDPRPEDRVLDMCAAPGSKTTQMSAMMKNKGEIMANDIRPARTRSLLSNLYRLGCVNVQVLERDGRNLPESPKFDKILVDAPCSGESTYRGGDEPLAKPNLKRIEELAGLQEKLLRKAFRMCKTGGTIVYSTCTFAPEENELVVSRFLEEGVLKNPDFDFPHSAGITEWNEKRLDNSLKRCVRIYPHHLNSGGIFLAKFRKDA